MKPSNAIKPRSVLWTILLTAIIIASVPWQARAEDAAEADWPLESISLSAFIDGRFTTKDFDWDSDIAEDRHESDIYARYAGVGFSFKPNENVEGYMLFLFEEFFADSEGDNFDMDEGWIKLSQSGAFLTIGKMYAPFAHESTYGAEDPITWYFADTRKSAAEIGYENDYFYASATLFNGDFDTVDKNGDPDDERVDDYVLHMHATPLADSGDVSLEIGAGYISDITETGLDFGNEFLTGNYEDPVSAYSVYFNIEAPITSDLAIGIDAEHIQSNKFDRDNYVDLDGDKTGIASGNYEIVLLGDRWRAGAQYAYMDGFDWLRANDLDPALTPTRFESIGAFGGVQANDNLTITLQAMSGRDDEGNTLVETHLQFLVEI